MSIYSCPAQDLDQDRQSQDVSPDLGAVPSPNNLENNNLDIKATSLDSPAPEFPLSYRHGLGGRRRKAATVLVLAWGGTIALHLVTWGTWFVLVVTGLVGLQVLRIFWARPSQSTGSLPPEDPSQWPKVSLVVAAKNEASVIGSLVQSLCQVDYPRDRYEVWIIDDASQDQTPQVLQQLQSQYSQLQVLRRAPGAKGGKSGALNQVLPKIKGDVMAVFDADAKVPQDLLQKVLPLFQQERVGAVQVRKAIANSSLNFWTKGQESELMFDAFFQQQRIAAGGLGELRGNGQFIRRTALEQCGGFNEETITDDLDLTFRLHLDQWDIAFCFHPHVGEEGVTRPLALWHQRNRWAEGGYQRCLDYWHLISRNRMGTKKSLDLLCFFWITQYLLPTVTLPDLMMAILRNRPPIYAPLGALTVTFSMVTMFLGIRQARLKVPLHGAQPEPRSAMTTVAILSQTIQGVLYMLHWFVVMASTMVRMSVRPKRLKWVKTTHHGETAPTTDGVPV